MIGEGLAHEVLDQSTFANRWGFTPRRDYVVVTDVLGQSVVSIVFRKQTETLGYGRSEYLINGNTWEHYARVTTYKPVYEASRPIAQLTTGTVQEVVRQLRTPKAVRHLVESAKAREDAAVARGTLVAAEILHGLAPLATGIDQWRAGNRASAMLSFAGDAATILSFGGLGAAKYAQVAGTAYRTTKWAGRVRIATTGLGLLEGTGRGIQGVKLLIDSDGRQGYGYIGEAFLRLLGVRAELKAGKVARRVSKKGLLDRVGEANLPYRTKTTLGVKLSRFFATRTGYQQVIKHSKITKWLQKNWGWQSHHWAIARSHGLAGSEGLRRITEAGWNLIPLPARWNRAIGNGGPGFIATRLLVGASPGIAFYGGYEFGSFVIDVGWWLTGGESDE